MNADFSGLHASIDLETMSLASNAVILSVGIVVFDFSGVICERHELYPSITEQLGKGRDVSGDTMRWWTQQTGEALDVFDKPRDLCSNVLKRIAGITSPLEGVWGYGAAEDNAKLTDLGLQFGQAPWFFRKNRCGRTLIGLAGGPDNFEWPTRQTAAHTALGDAEAQALAYVKAAGIICGLKP